ncbi:glycosyltransferase [Nonlabens sp.]|uniref:glycosyltransferase n=1 Tax=Nonlabens sp. TaxID=1888209 RepID=UPI003F6954F9
MQNILFVESGVHEGGSFMSLAKHIEALDKTKNKPIVVFFNTNNWVTIFREKGYKVYLINDNVFSKHKMNLHSTLNAFFMKGFVKFKVIPFLKWLHKDAIKKLETIIEKDKVDYVHLNTELFRDRIGLIAGINKKIPIISHLRSKYQLGKIHFSKKYINFANEHVEKYIAVSNDTSNFWVTKVGLESSKIQTLYDYFEPINNSDNVDVFQYDGLKLVCVSNIVPVKGLEFLIKSCAPILKTHKAKLFIVGKGDSTYLEKLTILVRDLNLVDSVKFVGYRNDVNNFLQAADVVLLFSKREGLPNVVIEAMGCQAIIIASEVGGIPEIVNDNENGFLVPSGDVKIATEKIESVLQLTNEAVTHIKANSVKTIEGKFSKEYYCSTILKLYE